MALLLIAAAGLASMTAAMERGDVEEAARQGALAGPAVVSRALAAPRRATVLAGIAAAPSTPDRAELLAPLAALAAGPDRRTAIPAAHAARLIADELARADRPDDLAADDFREWAAAWRTLAARRERWIEVRADALAVAQSLTQVVEPDALGFDLPAALADPDPDLRAAAIALVPAHVPAEARPALGVAVSQDAVPANALAAAQAVCADLTPDSAAAILAALGPAGLTALRALVVAPGAAAPAVRDAARCLAADPAPESAAALAKIPARR